MKQAMETRREASGDSAYENRPFDFVGAIKKTAEPPFSTFVFVLSSGPAESSV
jgi:hypothetical protein